MSPTGINSMNRTCHSCSGVSRAKPAISPYVTPLVSQDVRFRQPREPGDWHAVLASEIAAICHRDAQIFDLSPEAVAQRLDHGLIAPSGCVGSTQCRPPSM